jgi:mono/diheme cytochrome c family protein
MLKPFLVLCAVILFEFAALTPTATLAAGAAPQDTGTPAPTNPVKSTAASQEKAKKMYAVDCAVCHGDTGDGKTDLAKDMNLTLLDYSDPRALASKSDQQLFDLIRKGKDKMPAEDASRAKDAEVWGLVTYIRALSKNQPIPAPSAPAAAPAPDAPAAAPAPTN